MRPSRPAVALTVAFAAMLTVAAQQPPAAQTPPQPPTEGQQGGRGRGAGRGAGGGGGGFANAYPPRPPGDPAAIERGKALYGVHCTFCHGVDTRGGDSGPSLLRSLIVLDDQSGELI